MHISNVPHYQKTQHFKRHHFRIRFWRCFWNAIFWRCHTIRKSPFPETMFWGTLFSQKEHVSKCFGSVIFKKDYVFKNKHFLDSVKKDLEKPRLPKRKMYGITMVFNDFQKEHVFKNKHLLDSVKNDLGKPRLPERKRYGITMVSKWISKRACF